MDMIGIDLHKRESQLCILAGGGTMTEQRIVTSRERFTAVLRTRAPARMWRDGTPYDASRLRTPRAGVAEAS